MHKTEILGMWFFVAGEFYPQLGVTTENAWIFIWKNFVEEWKKFNKKFLFGFLENKNRVENVEWFVENYLFDLTL